MAHLLILIIISLFVSGLAQAEKRALVLGVNSYENLPPLKKAVDDARALALLLKNSGYIVQLIEDPTREVFWRGWFNFVDSIGEGDEIALFFSGHGLEIASINYLLMRDAPKAARGEGIIRQEGINFIELLGQLQARRPRVNLVILDACRSNPYAASGTKSIGSSKGLAVVEPPEGAFVMYSAGAKEEALDRLSEDDPEPVSVYMRNLLPLLRTPGLRIQDVAQDVRDRVRAVAAALPHKQNPAYYDELRGQFCFSGCASGGLSIFPRVNQPSKQGLLQPSPSAGATDRCSISNPPLLCLWKDKY